MRHKRRDRLAPALVLVAVLSQACVTTVPTVSPTPEPPVVTIDAGITPRMTAEQVEAIVIGQIHSMESMVGYVVRPARIVSVTATAGIRWKVEAEGTFTTNRYPPGASPGVAGTGHFEINDADGSIVGFGYP